MFNSRHFNSISIWGALCVAGGLMTACDDVPEADRFIEVERPVVARKVLIQEFTGLNCVNCPTGAAKVHEIQEYYPNSVIAVSLHPGGTGFSGPIGNFSLNTDLSRVYYDYFTPAGFPAAMIDGSTPETNVNLWMGAVSKRISVPAPAETSLQSDYDDASRNLTINYEVDINNVYSQNLNINLWIVESGIVGPQKSGNRLIFDYVHNHVFRTSLTGDWGTSIGNYFIPEQTITGSASIQLDEKWKPENCHIVAFLMNDAKEVQQAEEIAVIAEAAE